MRSREEQMPLGDDRWLRAIVRRTIGDEFGPVTVTLLAAGRFPDVALTLTCDEAKDLAEALNE